MRRDARVYIEDILEAITKIEEYMKEVKLDEGFMVIPKSRMLF